MAVRKIVKYGDETLRKICKPIELFDDRLHKLLDDMADTMYASNGVGLAAIQVGVLKRIAVVDIGEGLFEFINPVIVESSGEQIGAEGCLSVEAQHGEVSRPQRLLVKTFDRNGKELKIEATDYFARAICHELDHLDGILYIDKVINR